MADRHHNDSHVLLALDPRFPYLRVVEHDRQRLMEYK
jgi:hypothetical protein